MTDNGRCKNRKALLCALLFTVHGTSLAAPEIALISGAGYQPTTLERGDEVNANTVVRVDANTIVVLMDAWRTNDGKRCEEYVIIRGRDYRVPSDTPDNCNETGSGRELSNAMSGQNMLARVRALAFSGAAADIPNPENIERLQQDLNRLHQQQWQQQQAADEARRQQQVRAQRAADARRQEVSQAQQAAAERERAAQREAELRAREAAAREEAAASPEYICMGALRRSIARDESGANWWDAEKAKQLCAGTLVAAAPPRCFYGMLRGRAPDTDSSDWTRDEALALCRGVSDVKRTFGCFALLRANDVSRSLAIEACSGGQ